MRKEGDLPENRGNLVGFEEFDPRLVLMKENYSLFLNRGAGELTTTVSIARTDDLTLDLPVHVQHEEKQWMPPGKSDPFGNGIYTMVPYPHVTIGNLFTGYGPKRKPLEEQRFPISQERNGINRIIAIGKVFNADPEGSGIQTMADRELAGQFNWLQNHFGITLEGKPGESAAHMIARGFIDKWDVRVLQSALTLSALGFAGAAMQRH